MKKEWENDKAIIKFVKKEGWIPGVVGEFIQIKLKNPPKRIKL